MLIALAFLIGLGVLVAIVTKRPGVVAIVGLAMLLVFGGLLASLIGIRSVSHSNVHVPQGINIYPEGHHDGTIVHPEMFDQVPMPHIVDGTSLIPPVMDGTGEAWSNLPTISSPMAGSSSSVSHFRAKFVMFPVLLVGGAMVAIVVAVISRRKSSASMNGRGSWWPALMLIPVFAVLALSFIGFFGLRVTREFGGVPQIESLHQDFGQEHAASSHADVVRASQLDAHQARMNAAHFGHVEELNNLSMASANQAGQSLYIAATMAQLQRQFATMDINRLIAIFEAPKIELSSTSETPAASAPPAAAIAPANPAAPVVTAPIVKVSEGTTSEIVEVAKPQDKPAEVAADQTNKASGKKRNKPKVDNNSAATSASKVLTPIKKSEPLPDWIDDQPGMVGDDWREVIATDEYATAEECRQAMDIYLMLKTAERIQTLTGYPYADRNRPSLTFHQGLIMADGNVIFNSRAPLNWQDVRLDYLSRLGIGIDEIRRSVVREQHLASRDSPRALDTMYKQYTHAQFTPWFDSQLRRHWDSYRRHERFAVVGVGAGSVLGLLGFVFGLLKIDTWTKGYYTKRLFIGVPGAIIGGILLFSFFVEVLN